MARILRENLQVALGIAIQVQEQTAVELYARDGSLVQRWKEVLEALEEGEDVEIV